MNSATIDREKLIGFLDSKNSKQTTETLETRFHGSYFLEF